ncbi:uridine kinase family protein, partial [Acaryochloris marina NIES-2412]
MTIIGIAGGSGSGKTPLANALVDRCNGSALLVSHDRYYRYMPCGNYD